MTYIILKQCQKYILAHFKNLQVVKQKFGDTPDKRIQKELNELKEFLPKLQSEIKEQKPSKAISKWTEGTKQASKNYHPKDLGKPW